MAHSAKNPLSEVREKFQSKEKLVEKLLELIPKKEGQSKDEQKKSLLKTSNKKLLVLHARFAK